MIIFKFRNDKAEDYNQSITIYKFSGYGSGVSSNPRTATESLSKSLLTLNLSGIC